MTTEQYQQAKDLQEMARRNNEALGKLRNNTSIRIGEFPLYQLRTGIEKKCREVIIKIIEQEGQDLETEFKNI